jgi:hypothetical protein
MADPLTAAAMGISALGTAIGAGGTLMGGNASADALQATRFNQLLAAKNKSDELRMAATEAQAAAGRDAYEFSRNKNMLLSKARANAGMSGGGVADTSVVNTMAGIENQGEFQKAMALYSGENKARGLNYEADNAWKEALNNDAATQYQADTIRRKSRMDAFGTILSGAGSALNQYRLGYK